MAMLQAQQLSAGYGRITIVEDANLRVDEREIVTIVGPNGSGKSTLLKSLIGVVRVFTGRVWYRGADITGARLDRLIAAGMSYVPQTDNIFTNLTIRENLEMGAYRTNGADAVRADVAAIFELFPELEPFRERKAGTLSGGERQMLALARALMTKPQLLILDEPTANLAPKAVAKIHEKIREIREKGVAVLMVEQNAKRALAISNRGYIMLSGRVIFEGSPADVVYQVEVEKVYFPRQPPAA